MAKENEVPDIRVPEGTGAPVGHDQHNPHRDSKVTRMGTASVPRLVVEFAIPSIVGMLVNGLYNIVDSAFLGQAMGSIGLAVGQVSAPIMIIFMAISMLVGNGGNALAALRMGEGNRTAAERSLGNTVTLCVILAVLVAVLAFVPVTIDGLLMLSSCGAEEWDYAKIFIQINAAGFILQCIGWGVNNFIRTAGAPNRALGTMIIGIVVCTLLNALFVLVLGWGVVGSALATIIGQGVACICVLWFFVFTKNVPLKLHKVNLKLEAPVVRTIFALGTASFCVQAGAAIVNLVINAMVMQYAASGGLMETDAFAIMSAVQKMSMFTVLPLVGMAIAIQPLLGFNYGAHLFSRVRKTWLCGVVGAMAIGLLNWSLVHFFPMQLMSIFGIDAGTLGEYAAWAIQVQLMILPLIGFQIVSSNYFQATGQPAKSIFLSSSRQLIFLLPLYVLLPQYLPQLMPPTTGLDALFFAAPTSDVLATVTTAVFIVWELRRLRKLESGELKAKF